MKFEKDKQQHFIAGALVGGFVALLGYPALSWLFAGLVGAFKELYDHFTPGRGVDFWDFVYTALPGVIISLVYLLKG